MSQRGEIAEKIKDSLKRSEEQEVTSKSILNGVHRYRKLYQSMLYTRISSDDIFVTRQIHFIFWYAYFCLQIKTNDTCYIKVLLMKR